MTGTRVSNAVPLEDKSGPRTGVLCAGALVLDTLVRPFDDIRWGTTTFVESIETRVGGSAANTARALGLLGVAVRVTAFLGKDQAASTIRSELSRCHVELSSIIHVDTPTAETVVLINSAGDRQFLHRKGCSEIAFGNGLEFSPELTSRMAHFHLASLYVVPNLRQQAPTMLHNARAAGLKTSLDTCWDPRGEWMRVLAPCLPYLDILFMNEDEAAQICPGKSVPEAGREISLAGTGMVVVKNSYRGCHVYTQGREIICPAYEVTARDTTGAGDCFVAGFLAAHLKGETPERAGLMGNAAGALSVQQIGAVEGLLQIGDMEEWMAQTALRALRD